MYGFLPGQALESGVKSRIAIALSTYELMLCNRAFNPLKMKPFSASCELAA